MTFDSAYFYHDFTDAVPEFYYMAMAHVARPMGERKGDVSLFMSLLEFVIEIGLIWMRSREACRIPARSLMEFW